MGIRWEDFDDMLLVEQTDIKEYFKWRRLLVEDRMPQLKEKSILFLAVSSGKCCAEEIFIEILDVAERWNVPWQYIKESVEKNEFTIGVSLMFRDVSDVFGRHNIRCGIPLSEIENAENLNPDLKKRAITCQVNKLRQKERDESSARSTLERIIVNMAFENNNDYLNTVDINDAKYSKMVSLPCGNPWKEKVKASIIYLIEKLNSVHGSVDGKIKKEKISSCHNDVYSRTLKATNAKQKKQIQELIAGYEGAARLASEIGRRGQKNGTPWSESEVLTLADELGVSLKGDCLRAFKAGMPADLVKKDAGARPITPREESPDDVES